MATALGSLPFNGRLSEYLLCFRMRRRPVHRWVVLASVVLIGLLVGQSTLSFALAPLVIVLWACSRTRLQACLVIVWYTLATSWTLVPSYVQYMTPGAGDSWLSLGADMGFVLGLWLVAALLSAMPWALLYRPDHRCLGARLSALAVFLCLPPLGLFHWMSPFLGLAYLTLLTGWMGVIAGMVVLVMFIRYPRTLIAYPIVVVLSITLRADVELLARWEAFQTSLSGRSDYDSWVERFSVLRAAGKTAARSRPAVLLLGESVGGNSLNGARMALGQSASTTFLVGGAEQDDQGAEAQLWQFGRGESHGSIVYRQRVVVPVVSKSGARALAGFATGIESGPMSGFGWLPFRMTETTIDVDGSRVAPLICYESLTAWAMISAVWAQPDVIVLITNTAWSALDPFAHAQLASHVRMWGRLFGIPVLIASNRAS